jgi:hypothetical protein
MVSIDGSRLHVGFLCGYVLDAGDLHAYVC